MKSPKLLIFSILSAIFLFSCNDSSTEVGGGIQSTTDEIHVDTATIFVTTENLFVDSILSNPDSLLLGNLSDDKYGAMRAEIFTQVEAPVGVGFSYPENALPDSALVQVTFSTWFGDPNSPIEMSVYEMTKSTFVWTGSYYTNINPESYVNTSSPNLIASRIFTANGVSTDKESGSKVVSLRVDGDFYKNRFYKNDSNVYKSDLTFFEFFKGMYIKTNFGSSTMLNIYTINLVCYYHYTYINSKGEKVVVSNKHIFPASDFVRQVNRIVNLDRERVKEKLNAIDSVNYISSPANIQTRVSIPLASIKRKMTTSFPGKTHNINSAILRVEVTDVDASTFAKKMPSTLLLIKDSSEEKVQEFFAKGEVPSSSNFAVLSTISQKQIYNTTLYARYFDFNLVSVLTRELKANSNEENVIYRLLPVSVETNKSGSISKVLPLNSVGAITLRSSKNQYSPMRIRMMYSGF